MANPNSLDPTRWRKYLILLIGSLLGLTASFLQMIEKLTLLSHQNTALPCDISSVFNCSTVLNAPQSSLFGFPNALMCIVLFSMFTMLAIVGLTGGKITEQLHSSMLGVVTFFLLFALWFLFTSTFVIGAICIFCLICFSGLLLMAGSLTRIIARNSDAPRAIQYIARRDYDIFALLVIAGIVIIMIALKFYV